MDNSEWSGREGNVAMSPRKQLEWVTLSWAWAGVFIGYVLFSSPSPLLALTVSDSPRTIVERWPRDPVQNRRCRCSTQRTERSYGQYAVIENWVLEQEILGSRLKWKMGVIAINCQYRRHHNDQNEREGHTVSCEVKCANDEPVQ